MAADLGAPDMEEAKRLTNEIIDLVGSVDMSTFLTVLVNLAGQIVAELADRKPSLIQLHANGIAENIKVKAIDKMLRDDAIRRAEDGQNEGRV